MLTKKQIIKIAIELSAKHTHNATYAGVVDFTRPSNHHRFFLVNVKEQEIIYSWFTSHGSGSGSVSGKGLRFSNIKSSRMSSDGLLKTANTYLSPKFKSLALRLVGLEENINDNVAKRAIVIHRSDYVAKDYMRDNWYPGRSWGCITLDPKISDQIIHMLKGGSVVFIAGEQSLKRFKFNKEIDKNG